VTLLINDSAQATLRDIGNPKRNGSCTMASQSRYSPVPYHHCHDPGGDYQTSSQLIPL
jgi:hypothetical protein